MMKAERMIEILAEEKHKLVGLYDAAFWIGIVKAKLQDGSPEIVPALTAMQRVCEEYEADMRELERQRNEDALSALGELNHLRAELDRLKQCEAIVRQLAIVKRESSYPFVQYQAREWVRDNPK